MGQGDSTLHPSSPGAISKNWWESRWVLAGSVSDLGCPCFSLLTSSAACGGLKCRVRVSSACESPRPSALVSFLNHSSQTVISSVENPSVLSTSPGNKGRWAEGGLTACHCRACPPLLNRLPLSTVVLHPPAKAVISEFATTPMLPLPVSLSPPLFFLDTECSPAFPSWRKHCLLAPQRPAEDPYHIPIQLQRSPSLPTAPRPHCL